MAYSVGLNSNIPIAIMKNKQVDWPQCQPVSVVLKEQIGILV